MDAPRGESPERLLESGATDFERRLLKAAATAGKTGPSRETSMRMASALGVSLTPGAGTATVAKATAAKTAVAGGSAAGWPWIVGGVIGLSVVGALVVGGPWRTGAPDARSVPTVAVPAVSPPVEPPATLAAAGSAHPVRATAAGPDLHDEIELLDGARAAVSARSGRRALELLRRYQDRYPAGSFVPEATAVRVEALVQLGRNDEARALAERFVTEHRGSLLSDRVAAVAGLSRR